MSHAPPIRHIHKHTLATRIIAQTHAQTLDLRLLGHSVGDRLWRHLARPNPRLSSTRLRHTHQIPVAVQAPLVFVLLSPRHELVDPRSSEHRPFRGHHICLLLLHQTAPAKGARQAQTHMLHHMRVLFPTQLSLCGLRGRQL